MRTKILSGYEESSIAVNAVILTIKDGELLVYLNSREKEPYKNLSELPGGLLRKLESAEQTLSRKIKDIFGKKNVFLKQFYSFTKPNRDPRGRVVSIGFIALISPDKVANFDNFQRIGTLPKLAFDHKEIIEKALEYLKENLDNQIVKEFMPPYFPLNGLQTVHEIIGKKKLDNRNFRKKIISSGTIRKVTMIQKNVPHRPAVLYRFI
ncbi:MAG: NUDIX hydrolase [Candidatus Woesebacteria bacterium]|nr:MAG: NUDIX hydrolase [Candidatus Woesebacteria bacterium]